MNTDQLLYNLGEIRRVVLRNLRVLTLQHFLKETIHVISFEGRLQSANLIKNTT